MGKFKTVNEFLNLFPEKPRDKTSTGVNVVCPVHNDHDPSLSVSQNNGKLLLHCQAGCETKEILNKLNLIEADLFLDTDNYSPPPKKKPTTIYPYPDENGKLAYEILRYGNGEGKTFKGRRPDPDSVGDFIWNVPEEIRVLYNLPKVLKAAKEGKIVYICEGEKDADRLSTGGIGDHWIATTNPFGAGKWKERYSESLRGANIVIIPDNDLLKDKPDTTGWEHALFVAKSCYGKAKSIKLLQPFPDAKDISDWLDKGELITRFIEIVDQTPLYQPDSIPPDPPDFATGPDRVDSPIVSSLGDVYQFYWEALKIWAEVINVSENNNGLSGEIRITHSETGVKYLATRMNFLSDQTKNTIAKRLREKRDIDWESIIDYIGEYIIADYRTGEPIQRKTDLSPIPDNPYRVYPYILEGQASIFYGYGESYKSWLGMLIALLTHNGIKYLGLEPIKGNVLELDFENDDATYNQRCTAIQNGLSMGELDFPLYKNCRGKTMLQLASEVRKQILENDVKLVVIDSMTMAAGGYDEQMTIAYFGILASFGVSSLTIDHRAKGLDKGSSPIGSVVKSNIARIVSEMTSEYVMGTNYGNIILKNTKNNNDVKVTPRYLRIEFEKEGRVTSRVIFSELDPDTIVSATPDDKPNTRQVLINYFKSHDNQPATPTDIALATGSSANTLSHMLNRSGAYFDSRDGGTWRIKPSFLLTLKVNEDSEGHDTPKGGVCPCPSGKGHSEGHVPLKN